MSDSLGIPDRIGRLKELAYNFWWSWQPEGRKLFEAVDRPLWKRTHHNPVAILRDVPIERLKEVAADPSFLRQYDGVMKRYDHEHGPRETWLAGQFPDLRDETIAYFSAEFGLHNSLPIYSGGLGLLAGDHCKEAGELGLPLVGIGFLYPQGYFHQKMETDGSQTATYRPLDVSRVAIARAVFPKTGERLVPVPVGPRTVYIAVWQVQVGRVCLYLMDTDVEENAPWDRELSARLYGGDQELRIRQEIVLGVGGVRVLRALGIHPTIWHCNEGHTSFQMLERIREKVETGESFDEAAETVRKRTIFTTHTPVDAGHDAFPSPLIEKYFSSYWPLLRIDQGQFWELGRHKESWGEAFNMTVLALHLSARRNAVSRLHGKVSRRMWRHIRTLQKEDDIPIISITNGIHAPTWTAPEIKILYRKHLAPDWVERQDDPVLWQRISDIPDKDLWEIRQKLKLKLLSFIRERARLSWVQERADPVQLLASGTLLDPETLTIGYARRFAAYKRATLILQDIERLIQILGNRRRPIQIIFSGKAHPADDHGKHLLQTIYNLTKDSRIAGHIAFVENYDMHVAHFLVQGVDVWLNTPRPPLEASGTSGMKAALNGVPQIGMLDGWWPEGYNGSNGWVFGQSASETSGLPESDDAADAENLYRVIEEQVAPLYYLRDRDGVPRGWIELVKETIRSIAPVFSMRRVVKEYTEKLYVPAINGKEEQGNKTGRTETT
ncbi:MAG: alpha-glucan family phosphorylase [Nitrospiria bacterium]